MRKRVCLTLFFIFLLSYNSLGQTGGTFDLSHNVIAGGGGSQSIGGSFTLSGTAGQPSAGTFSIGGSLNLRGGFWAFDANTPTASTVSIQGQIKSVSGKPISDITVLLIDIFTNTTRTTLTNEKGRYFFDELEVNHLYIVKVSENKLFTFTPESQMFELRDNLTDINFTAIEIHID
jgi:hypothetical protein